MTPQWPAAPSLTCVQSGRSEPSPLELVPDGTATCGSGSDTPTHTHEQTGQRLREASARQPVTHLQVVGGSWSVVQVQR